MRMTRSGGRKVFQDQDSLWTPVFESRTGKFLTGIYSNVFLVFFAYHVAVYLLDEGSSWREDSCFIANAFQNLHIALGFWAFYHLLALLVVYPATKWWFNSTRVNCPFVLTTIASGVIKITLFANIALCLLYVIGPASGLFLGLESVRLWMKITSFTAEVASIKKTNRLSQSTSGDETIGLSFFSYFFSPSSPSDTADASFIHETSGSGEVMSFSHFVYFLFAPTAVYRPSYPTRKASRNYGLISRYSFLCFTLFCISLKIVENTGIPLRKIGVNPLPFTGLARQIYWSFLTAFIINVIMSFGFQHLWSNIFAEVLGFGDRAFYSSWYRQHEQRRYLSRWNSIVQDWLFEYVNQPVRRRCGKRAGAVAVMFVSGLIHDYIAALTVGVLTPLHTFGFVFFVLFSRNRSGDQVDEGVVEDVNNEDRRPTARRKNSIGQEVANITKYMLLTGLVIGQGFMLFIYFLEYYSRQNCLSSFSHVADYFIPRFPWCVTFGTQVTGDVNVTEAVTDLPTTTQVISIE